MIAGTVRDAEYQLICYQNGTSKTKVPSFHAQGVGLAFDVCKNVKGHEYDDSDFFKKCAKIGKNMGFEWGGDWKSFVDMPHFQWSNYGKYTSNDILAGRLPPPMPLYSTEEESETVVYKDIKDIPAWGRPIVQKLIDNGTMKGDENGSLNVSDDMLRILVILQREGVIK